MITITYLNYIFSQKPIANILSLFGVHSGNYNNFQFKCSHKISETLKK